MVGRGSSPAHDRGTPGSAAGDERVELVGVLLEVPARDSTAAFDNASPDFQFAASVAAFGMLLRESPHRGTATIDDVLRISMATAGVDSARNEFVELVRKAALIR